MLDAFGKVVEYFFVVFKVYFLDEFELTKADDMYFSGKPKILKFYITIVGNLVFAKRIFFFEVFLYGKGIVFILTRNDKGSNDFFFGFYKKRLTVARIYIGNEGSKGGFYLYFSLRF